MPLASLGDHQRPSRSATNFTRSASIKNTCPRSARKPSLSDPYQKTAQASNFGLTKPKFDFQ
ncbi:hypothetical protein A2U01_0078783, partial [Trifolium medium]|nr:hypothetical protein [Trifolium medium]